MYNRKYTYQGLTYLKRKFSWNWSIFYKRCSHRSLLSALNHCLWRSTRIQSIQNRKDDEALRWKSLLWISYLWSVQMPSTIKWYHNLASSVAFSAGLIENTLEHVSICDWLASLSNRFKKWGVNGSLLDIKVSPLEFDALSIHAQLWRFMKKEIKRKFILSLLFLEILCIVLKST